MRRISYKPYVILALLLLSILSLSPVATESVRSASVATLAPPWRVLNFLKVSALKLFAFSSGVMSSGLTREMEVLKQENQMLQSQIEMLRQFLDNESVIEKELQELRAMAKEENDFFRRRKEEILRLVDLQSKSVVARVIFREPISWSSSFWINAGERTNNVLKKKVIAKNSPVVIGSSVVGIVEYVGYRRSRVRLISDSGLCPSVRVLRGKEQSHQMLEHLHLVMEDLSAHPEFKEALDSLGRVKEALASQAASLYLAKGEISGNSAPLWRSRGLKLRGVGFNYDFADEEGTARPLLNADPPLVKEGDLLVTTGMDGIFPSGLWVAKVVAVEALREGACAYELEAKATAGNLDNLAYVTVLPPLET